MSRKIIIPAAGFGTRVGQPQAKELMPRPDNGQPLISRALEIAYALNVSALVITRKEKVSLIQYLEKQNGGCSEVQVLLVEPTKEWPASILAAKDMWAEENVLILPDTDFQPIQIVENIFSEMKNQDLVVAHFKADPNSLSSFGVFAETKDRVLLHAEKPGITTPYVDRLQVKYNDQQTEIQNLRPWGLLGFRRSTGEKIFQQMLESTFDHDWRQVPGRVSFLTLEKFVDLTRKR